MGPLQNRPQAGALRSRLVAGYLAFICALVLLGAGAVTSSAYADDVTGDAPALHSGTETSETVVPDDSPASDEPAPTATPPAEDPASGSDQDSTPDSEESVTVESPLVTSDVAVSGLTRVEEDHVTLTYGGAWTSGTSAAASAGAYRYSYSAGATLTMYFKGTSVALIGPVGPTYGRIEIWLDGVKVATVSQYAAAYQHQQVVWSVAGLANADHTLVIRVTGTKEAASSGTIFVFDAFDIDGTVASKPSWLPDGRASHEEADSRTFREGRWTAVRTSAASGGSLLYTGTVGSTFTIHFSGSRVAWIGPRFTNYGWAAVYLDGIYQTTVSQYGASARHRQVIWSAEGLSNGNHTLMIKVLGKKDAASRGTVIAVDGFTVDELLVPRFEEKDSRIKRSGTWTSGTSTVVSGGGYVYSRQANAYVVVPFWGTAFAWIGMRGPSYGMAEVYLDGRSMGIVDLYSPASSSGEMVWAVSGLKDRYHVVVIRVLGRKSPMSAGANVVLDAFAFEGAGAKPAHWASRTVRIDDREFRLWRSGTWQAGASSAASSGTYLYSHRAGSTITVSFIGTSVAWIGPTGPAYGHARVFLDGVRVGTVSQYAPSFSHQQAVWSASGLADTVHTLTIHVLGTKDAASSGTIVVVDGFDVAGVQKQRFEERDRATLRSGTWQAGASSAASSGTYLYSHRAGSTITVSFIGTSVAWIGPTGPAYGHARVFLDGVRVGTVSQYAPSFSHQQAVWSASGLADTVHTLTIHVLGTKDAASSGTIVVVDGFDVAGERVTARSLIVSVAKQQLGKQYVWAASGPDTFDCSGLVLYACRAAGVSVPRTSRWQWSVTNPRFTTFEPLLPGDLCFLSSPSYIHHVGIYIGFGLSIHAPGTGKFVEYRTAHTWGCYGRVAASAWQGRYNGG
ncbi:MAG: C40 family peptidase [Coriobacteriia bacterium]|nr:C40 family peptidase [Coriobacteriia bacterium]